MQNTSLSMAAICSLQLARAKPGCFKWILSDLGSNALFKLKDWNKCPAIKVKADTSVRNASLSLKHECYPRETLRLSTRAGTWWYSRDGDNRVHCKWLLKTTINLGPEWGTT